MMMDGWVDYLHLDFLGEHILFRFLPLKSPSSFIFSGILITVLCLFERFLTVVLNKNVQPRTVRRSRLATAAWRSSVYGLVTFLRLLYMLVAMSYQLGAIAVVVVTLSIGQFAIEYAEYQEPNFERQVEEPLLGTEFGGRRFTGRSRGRSKPDAIFIHPNDSNLARADAVALELGVRDDTELIHGNRADADGWSWQPGKGKEVARATFGGLHHHLDSDTSLVLDATDGDRT